MQFKICSCTVYFQPKIKIKLYETEKGKEAMFGLNKTSIRIFSLGYRTKGGYKYGEVIMVIYLATRFYHTDR